MVFEFFSRTAFFRQMRFSVASSVSQGILVFISGLSGMCSVAASRCDVTKLSYIELGELFSVSACRASNLFLTEIKYWTLISSLLRVLTSCIEDYYKFPAC